MTSIVIVAEINGAAPESSAIPPHNQAFQVRGACMMHTIHIARLAKIDSIAIGKTWKASPIGLMREPTGSQARPQVTTTIKYVLTHSIATRVFLAILHDADVTLSSPT